MAGHIFTGFGFGPIQSGLFVNEAYDSKRFDRIVIAEIDQRLVDAVRANHGSYAVNVAHHNGIETQQISGIEIYNPTVEADRAKLLEVLACSTEICTSLPSVNFFDTGANSVASLIAQGLSAKIAPATIIYTAENNNHAAEILDDKVKAKGIPFGHPVQFLNTVIGKMSQVIADPAEIADKKLAPIAPGIERAFLVEAFNKILVTKCHIPNFTPGISVFIEKEDLLPFEEAKLYGHNAIHALLAYMGVQRGCKKMAELAGHSDLMAVARAAFIDESGAALCKKHAALGDVLFTPDGFKDYAEDLLTRMTNPYLDDAVERAARDPQRKLDLTDRIFGTMNLCLEQGIEPKQMATGAAAGLAYLLANAQAVGLPGELAIDSADKLTDTLVRDILAWLWKDKHSPHTEKLIQLVQQSRSYCR